METRDEIFINAKLRKNILMMKKFEKIQEGTEKIFSYFSQTGVKRNFV